jgi:diaminopimelate decarboxylase
MTAGAYGAVQAGTYNTRPLVPEVLVREGEWALVRPRIEAEAVDCDGPAAAVAMSATARWRANTLQRVD